MRIPSSLPPAVSPSYLRSLLPSFPCISKPVLHSPSLRIYRQKKSKKWCVVNISLLPHPFLHPRTCQTPPCFPLHGTTSLCLMSTFPDFMQMQAYMNVFWSPPLLFQREHIVPVVQIFCGWSRGLKTWAAGILGWDGAVQGPWMPPQRPFKSGHVPGHFSNFPPSHDTFKETTNPARVVRSCLMDFIKNQTPATTRPCPPPKIKNSEFEAKVSTMNLYRIGS